MFFYTGDKSYVKLCRNENKKDGNERCLFFPSVFVQIIYSNQNILPSIIGHNFTSKCLPILPILQMIFAQADMGLNFSPSINLPYVKKPKHYRDLVVC